MSAYRNNPRVSQVGDTQFVVQSDHGWVDVYWDRYEWKTSDGRSFTTKDDAFAAILGQR
jgi:hypothetical protein